MNAVKNELKDVYVYEKVSFCDCITGHDKLYRPDAGE